jgi:predicted Holliday junction resolvase-like endonuclease
MFGVYLFAGIIGTIMSLFVYFIFFKKKNTLTDETTLEIGDEWKNTTIDEQESNQVVEEIPSTEMKVKKVYIDKKLDEIKQDSIKETKKIIKKVSEDVVVKKTATKKTTTTAKKTTKKKPQ